MKILLWLFGWPHEGLHVLALRLIGRQPQAVTQTHVDIPDDLSTGQYIFVAGLPALVFWGATVASSQQLFNASAVPQVILWLAITSIAALAALGTLGDLYLIVIRLMTAYFRPPDDYD